MNAGTFLCVPSMFDSSEVKVLYPVYGDEGLAKRKGHHALPQAQGESGEERRGPTEATKVSRIQPHRRTRTKAADRPKAIARFKERIREQTRRTRGISLQQMVKAVPPTCGHGSDTSAIVKRPRCCNVLKSGYAAHFARWCGSNRSVDERGFASFDNRAWVKIWRRKPLVALTARGGSRSRSL
jgi:hypothetical protein